MNKKIILALFAVLTALFFLTLSIIKQSSQINIKPTTKPLIEDRAVKLPTDEKEIIFGNPGAPITITEFFSFECEKCAELHNEIISFVSSNPRNTRLITQSVAKKNWLGNKELYPLLALACAEKQNNYFNFLNKAIQLKKIDEAIINKLATETNLDSATFDACLQDKETKTKIEAEQNNLEIFGLIETPLIFINNKKINLTDDVKITDILKNIITE